MKWWFLSFFLTLNGFSMERFDSEEKIYQILIQINQNLEKVQNSLEKLNDKNQQMICFLTILEEMGEYYRMEHPPAWTNHTPCSHFNP